VQSIIFVLKVYFTIILEFQRGLTKPLNRPQKIKCKCMKVLVNNQIRKISSNLLDSMSDLTNQIRKK